MIYVQKAKCNGGLTRIIKIFGFQNRWRGSCWQFRVWLRYVFWCWNSFTTSLMMICRTNSFQTTRQSKTSVSTGCLVLWSNSTWNILFGVWQVRFGEIDRVLISGEVEYHVNVNPIVSLVNITGQLTLGQVSCICVICNSLFSPLIWEVSHQQIPGRNSTVFLTESWFVLSLCCCKITYLQF